MKNTRQQSVWISTIGVRVALTLLAAIVTMLISTVSAQAQTYSILHAFAGNADGGGPFQAPLIRDPEGNLYGTTTYGGSSRCTTDIEEGCGTVFKIDKTGKHTVLHRFTGGVDGKNPYAGLTRDATGNLFGTTAGGFVDGAPPFGGVFKLDTTGRLTSLYEFKGGTDGAFATGGLIRDASGNFYGVTDEGGTFGFGTVFKLDSTGKETTLYSFSGVPDGENPLYENLVMDAKGNLYGTTYGGGVSNQGTVFKINVATGVEEVLYSFAGGTDGALPYSGLVFDRAGNLYGATSNGGGAFYGTIFKIDPTGRETLLYKFAGGDDGIFPMGGLVRDAKGNLWGTTLYGGTNGLGTVFKVTPGRKETLVHSFDISDGDTPWAGLLRDRAGNLYGTTAAGGFFNFGIVFKITP
jgi:uncharacterized repeat protein (TIGR03803 family)